MQQDLQSPRLALGSWEKVLVRKLFTKFLINTVQNNDTPTCQAVDRIAQYMTVFLGNLTNSQERTASCRAVRPYCNTFLCTLPNRAGFYNNSFLPCTNPIGFNSQILDTLANITGNVTLYESGTFNATPYSSSELTLNQLGPGMVGFGVSTYPLSCASRV